MPSAIHTLEQHLLAALDPAPSETRRLFHGRGRCWPDLEQITVDWLQGVLLVGLFREPPPGQLDALQAMLLRLAEQPVWTGQAILIQHRYLPDSPGHWLRGEPQPQREVVEDGLRYLLDLGVRQNSGLFLDMRLGRRWVREQSAGRRVLNLFAYTCGFSVAAIAGGAEQVVNLDMAKSALARGRENHRLNGHDASRVAYLGHELFKSWGKVRKYGPYDLIIIDPPTFQRGSFVLTQDYAKILRRLPELLSEGGTVLACVNDPGIGQDFLIDGMAEHAPTLRFVERLANPPEFPDADPQGGLKALVFQR
ncbi:class I SAM-dependent methyltransferase [Pseudomonas entomophila]|uniref:class I SAM-dependent methyltransferase n=1 Tax=Pseudomonas entomophila TaxID=312306 RepID=UPI003EBAADE5